MMTIVLIASLISGPNGYFNTPLNSYYMSPLGLKPLAGFRHLVLNDTLVFIQSSNLTIDILNIASPPNIRLVKRLLFKSTIGSFAIKGRYLFINTDDSLFVYDISNIDNPVIEASLNISWTTFYGKLKIQGNYLLLINRYRGIRLVNISDPLNPTIVSTITESGSYYDAAIYNNYLYVAKGQQGIWLYDINNPSAPVYITTITDSSNRFEVVYIRDTILFSGDSRIYLINISNPGNPSIISSVGIHYGRYASGFATLNNYLFVSLRYNASFQVYDITNPLNISYLTEAGSEPGDAGVFASDHFVFIGGHEGFFVYDVSDPTNPVLLSRFLSTPVAGERIFLDGNMVYLVDWNDGLRILSFSDPRKPVEVGFYKDFSTMKFGVAKDSFAYVYYTGYTSAGLKVIDARVPESPILVRTLNVYGIRDMKIKDSLLFVLRRNDLKIYSISERENPVQIGVLDGLDDPMGICLHGSYAYITNTQSILIVDIQNPANPQVVAEFDTTGFTPTMIRIEGNYLFALGFSNYTGNFTLYVVDISNPTSPVLISYLSGTLQSQISAFAVNGPLVYIFSEPSAIFSRGVIVDVSDPQNPVLMGYIPAGNDAVVQDSIVYLLISNFAVVAYRTIEVPTPQLISPKDTIINDSLPSFVWSLGGYENAVEARIVIYSGVDSLVVDTGTVFGDTTYIPHIPLQDGVYRWYVKAILPTGWMDRSEVATFIVDANAPSTPTIQSPSGGQWLNDTSVLLQWSRVSKGTPVHYIFEIFRDSLSVITDTVDTNFALVNLTEGFYSWRVMAFDEAGNSSSWAVDSFGIDINPPVIDSVLTPGDSILSLPYVRVYTEDSLSGISDVRLIYWIDGSPSDSLVMNRDSACYSGEIPVDSGVHYVSFFVKAIDRAGNQSLSDTFNLWYISVLESDLLSYTVKVIRNIIYREAPVIMVNLPVTSKVKIDVFDPSGRLIITREIKGKRGLNRLYIEGLRSPGIYFLTVNTLFGERKFKLIKVK